MPTDLDQSLLGTLNGDGSPSPESLDDATRSLQSPLTTEGGDGGVSEDTDVEGASPRSSHEAHPMMTGWVLTTCVLLGDMFGLGALTLPADVARLGWLPGIFFLLFCAAGMAYTGVLFTRMVCALPRTGRFDDYGHAAFGHAGRILVGAVVYSTIFGEPPVFQLTCVESLKQILQTIFTGATWATNFSLGLIVALVMLPLAQVQGLEDVGWISIFGTLGMLLACFVVMGKLWFMPGPYPATKIIQSGSFNDKLVAFMDIVFTYGGQVNWIRYISSMKQPKDFTKTANVGAVFMMVIYLATASLGYHRLGHDFDHTLPITSVLPQDKWSIVANTGVLIHCIFAYQINLNVWTVMILHFLSPRTIKHPTLLSSRIIWFLVSASGIVFSFFIAFLFPFFSTVLALIAAVGDTSGAYTLPALFNLKLFRDKMPRWERWLCTAIVPVAGLLTCLGVYSSLLKLIQQFYGRGAGNALGTMMYFYLRV